MTNKEGHSIQAVQALRAACKAADLSIRGARLIRIFANAVYHLPAADVVARISLSDSPQSFETAMTALSVTKWLMTHGFPTVTPVVDRPVESNSCIVTFWRYLPQDNRPEPTLADLGLLLKKLHNLPSPPFPLPPHQPLRSIEHAIRSSYAVSEEERAWLNNYCIELRSAYAELDFTLPVGLIHGDAWRGNLLHYDENKVALGDWDSVSWGPRETDLIPSLATDRFGMPATQRSAFIAAYGYDITNWPGYITFRRIRELSTLTALLRNAHNDNRSLEELKTRIGSIRNDDNRVWQIF